jgi:hypothetical protein
MFRNKYTSHYDTPLIGRGDTVVQRLGCNEF